MTRGRGVPPERLAEVAEHYRRFGGVSPINAQCRALIDELTRSFAEAMNTLVRSRSIAVVSAPRLATSFIVRATTLSIA